MMVFLIGMPGSGKTSLGQIVAQRLGFDFIDLDRAVEEKARCAIPEIFAKQGEVGFRDLETRALCGLECNTPTLVATGGGIVLRPGNVEYMRQAGFVVYIDRPLEKILADISFSTRPLLAGADGEAKLKALLAERHGLYATTAHAVFVNDGELEEMAEGLCALVSE